MSSDVDLLEGLMLRLIQGMEELHVTWWVCNGWSIRRLSQLELVKEDEVNGNRSDHQEHEHEPEGELAPEVAPRVDDGVGRRRSVVDCIPISSSRGSKKALARPKPKAFSPSTRRRVRRRGWR